MNAADDEMLAREVAGKRARDEVVEIKRKMERMRLASFRSYLGATVNTMSSLVPDVLALVGWDIASALQRMRPADAWPRITGFEAEYGRTKPRWSRLIKVGGGYARRPAPPIWTGVIAEGTPGDRVEASIRGGSLDVTLQGDRFRLSTQDGTGYIQIEASLPDTVIAACVGRPLADLVDHPLLRSKDFVIEHAAQLGGTALSFDTGRLDLVLPWQK